ncbi:MAG: Sulfotransferase family [Fimbriimonadaceae bacterium]|jgi:hypothetical protein|nr:Sulfotransferase family [Fimbriimonadaceae bacterium]
MNQYVVVLGPYGSGSSAVTGILDKLGGYTCPPHCGTGDPRTRNTFEPHAMREILRKHINEAALIFTGNEAELAQELSQWLDNAVPKKERGNVIVLKHALLMLVLPLVKSLLQPKIIVVRRPYPDIERTRSRRGWPATQGYLGARILSAKMYADLSSLSMSFLDVNYPELIANPEREIARLAEFTGLDPDGSRRADALSFVRGSG